MALDDPLGHLIPPGSLTPEQIERLLIEAMDSRRFAAGLGVPSVPTRYVVTMNPSDRAHLDPTTEDQIAGALARHADAAGSLILGELVVEFRSDADMAMGRPRVWVGFSDVDLLVLHSPDAAAQVFADEHI
jgi:hypothetical protein